MTCNRRVYVRSFIVFSYDIPSFSKRAFYYDLMSFPGLNWSTSFLYVVETVMRDYYYSIVSEEECFHRHLRRKHIGFLRMRDAPGQLFSLHQQ